MVAPMALAATQCVGKTAHDDWLCMLDTQEQLVFLARIDNPSLNRMHAKRNLILLSKKSDTI
jgi:hypothetical protein